eukprot:1538387-Rhodomonas_salina.3
MDRADCPESCPHYRKYCDILEVVDGNFELAIGIGMPVSNALQVRILMEHEGTGRCPHTTWQRCGTERYLSAVGGWRRKKDRVAMVDGLMGIEWDRMGSNGS